MIESPGLREFEAEAEARATAQARADDVLTVLRARFSTVSEDVGSSIRSLRDPVLLQSLLKVAVRCPDLDAFRSRLASCGTAPAA